MDGAAGGENGPGRGRDGTVKLSGARRTKPGPVGGRDEPARRQVALRRVSVSGRGDQPGGLVVLPFPTQPADGRGDAGGTRHRCSYVGQEAFKAAALSLRRRPKISRAT